MGAHLGELLGIDEGAIEVGSAEDGGAAFTLRLPLEGPTLKQELKPELKQENEPVA